MPYSPKLFAHVHEPAEYVPVSYIAWGAAGFPASRPLPYVVLKYPWSVKIWVRLTLDAPDNDSLKVYHYLSEDEWEYMRFEPPANPTFLLPEDRVIQNDTSPHELFIGS